MRSCALRLGNGNNQERITFTSFTRSQKTNFRKCLRYSGRKTPLGWFGNPVSTVTSCPAATQCRESSETRAAGGPPSGGKKCEREKKFSFVLTRRRDLK